MEQPCDEARSLVAGVEHGLLPRVTRPGPWAAVTRCDPIGEELVITGYRGRLTRPLDTEGVGPPMFCMAIFVHGNASMAIEGGEPLQAGPGSAVVQSADRPVRGRFRAAAGQDVSLVDIRYTPAGLLRAGGGALSVGHGAFLQDRSVPAAGSRMLEFPAPRSLLRLAGEILDCEFQDPALRRLFLHAKALEALAMVLNGLRGEAGVPLSSRERRQLEGARALIEARFDEGWTVPGLARAVGMNEKKLTAGFRALAGQSVSVYLREIRLEAAARLLGAGHSVTETAMACGFSSLSHFSKVFREARGVALRDWARRLD